MGLGSRKPIVAGLFRADGSMVAGGCVDGSWPAEPDRGMAAQAETRSSHAWADR